MTEDLEPWVQAGWQGLRLALQRGMPVTVERCNTRGDVLHGLVREGLSELQPHSTSLSAFGRRPGLRQRGCGAVMSAQSDALVRLMPRWPPGS